jgi:primosomal replication protein N
VNQFQFVACVAERDILRYTPAGIPIVSARLEHRSTQMEAGIARLIEFEMSALAVGEISGRFNQAELGKVFQFSGFLARKNRNSKSLVFHIVDFEAASEVVSESALNILDTGAKNGIR